MDSRWLSGRDEYGLRLLTCRKSLSRRAYSISGLKESRSSLPQSGAKLCIAIVSRYGTDGTRWGTFQGKSSAQLFDDNESVKYRVQVPLLRGKGTPHTASMREDFPELWLPAIMICGKSMSTWTLLKFFNRKLCWCNGNKPTRYCAIYWQYRALALNASSEWGNQRSWLLRWICRLAWLKKVSMRLKGRCSTSEINVGEVHVYSTVNMQQPASHTHVGNQLTHRVSS